MLRSLLLLTVLSLSPTLSALASGSSTQTAPHRPARAQTAGWETFGDTMSKGKTVRLKKVMKKPGDFLDRTIKVEAPVLDVCAKKGCWMVMDAGEEQVRVRFKDYGFFVPKDIHGAKARVEGVLSQEVISVEMARHYLEDAGRHDEAASVTEAQKKYTFMATAVEIKR